jgi:osmotically-inducible protein OsmY
VRNRNPLLVALALLLAAGALSACATSSSPADANTAAAVKASLAQHPELAPPNMVYVQVRNGVAYLSGQVATDLQRETAAAAARSTPGVKRVVDTISLIYTGR